MSHSGAPFVFFTPYTIHPTKKIALRGDFFAYIRKKHYLCSRKGFEAVAKVLNK